MRAVDECSDCCRECKEAACRLCRTAAECSWAFRLSSATLELRGSLKEARGEDACEERDPRDEDCEAARQAKEGLWEAREANEGL